MYEPRRLKLERERGKPRGTENSERGVQSSQFARRLHFRLHTSDFTLPLSQHHTHAGAPEMELPGCVRVDDGDPGPHVLETTEILDLTPQSHVTVEVPHHAA